VDAIVDLFMAFVDWIVDQAVCMFETAFAEPIDIECGSSEIEYVSDKIKSVNGTNESVQYEVANDVGAQVASHFIDSELFGFIFTTCLMIYALISAISIMAMPAGSFLTYLIVPIVIMVVLPSLLDAMDIDIREIAGKSSGPIINQLLGDKLSSGLQFVGSIIIAAIGHVIEFASLLFTLSIWSVIGFTLSIIGLVTTIIAFTISDPYDSFIASFFGFCFAVGGLVLTLIGKDDLCGVTGTKQYLIIWSLLDYGLSLVGLETALVNYYER